MGRKKRQPEPSMGNDNESTESGDESQNGTFCQHVAKAVDLGKVKKALQAGILSECPQCERSPLQNGLLDDGFEYDLSLWLCLRCGNQACGRTRRRHALDHYNKPHSDCHALCVNTTIWNVWCYACDCMIGPSSKKKLLEAVEWLKKQSLAHVNTKSPIPLEYYSLSAPENADCVSSAPGATLAQLQRDLPRVRGLVNLGNTCFFNAVMQCLAQTPFLLPVLEEMATPGEHFLLPGGDLLLENQEPEKLPPLEGTLSAWGHLTEALCTALKELTSGRSDVYNPKSLLHQLTIRHAQFGGGDQHDSHELLRHLLEAVRSEDLRRYQAVILEKHGFSTKTDPTTVTGVARQQLKFYGQQASDLMIRTDQIFRGVLVSTLKCEDCEHTSHRDEFFLDLSLPVSADAHVPPSMRRKSDAEPMDTDKASKYQSKKEKRASRKAQKRQQKAAAAAGNTIAEEQPAGAGATVGDKSESEESDADVEDNLEDCKSPGGCEDPSKHLESGYNSEKVSDASPELNALDMDSGVMSPLTVNVPSPMCADESPHSGSSEANIELPSPQLPSLSPEDYERPISRLSFADKPAPMLEGSARADKSQQLAEAGDASRLEPLFGARVTGTVSPRYQCDEGECSVQSCLNKFTAPELMTGNNRVGCENCTKLKNGDDGKTVYTNATKQLLISSPPAVLILHLKRFQVTRYLPRKMSKTVVFPLVLDMAPFCSNRCKDLPSIDEQQSRLLYSLYGIVEHSGNIHGGHYIAYVKVRPTITADSYRWQFLSKPNASTGKQQAQPQPELGAQGDPTPPRGVWYRVSDSFVTRVPESEVLSAQAYLLFYERIL